MAESERPGGGLVAVPSDGDGAQPAQSSSKKPEIDLTIEPSLDSLRLYLRSIGRVDLLTAARRCRLAGASSAATCSRSSR